MNTAGAAKRLTFVIVAVLAGIAAAHAGDDALAGEAVNALGVDLYHAHQGGDANLLLSPYSIQSALAMTYAGADGDTRAEMQRALHYPEDEESLHTSFAALARQLATLASRSVSRARSDQKDGHPPRPLEFYLANTLFTQRGSRLQEPFLKLLKERYAATPFEVDFQGDAGKAQLAINRWVQTQTRDRIRDIMGPIRTDTRLVLVDAFYLRAPWPERQALVERFRAHGYQNVEIPTLLSRGDCGYVRANGMQIIACPYDEPDLQFVVAMPDDINGLLRLERALTPKLLSQWASDLKRRDIVLHLPKFHIAPPTLPLANDLKNLGMITAFDEPRGSANLGRMSPRQPDSYLALTEVLHRTYLEVDEKGTQAAAATAPMASALAAPEPPPAALPLDVRVDRPFLFAIQHVPSGACLFLGRVTDPR
ncbi:MAG TPA: serpin family protein [Chthoniobacter sp.]|nr:serpin family protein [Chthoniobacter sp.]